MNRNVIYWSIAVAVAGFLFGFDTAVISGADLPLQSLWPIGDLGHGLLIMSSALWGTVIGALFGNIPCDRYGRKLSLIGIGILYLVSAIGSAVAPDPPTFSIMRFIGGLGVGASSIVVPAYISEIAPAKYRGRLVVLYQFQLVFGILVARHNAQPGIFLPKVSGTAHVIDMPLCQDKRVQRRVAEGPEIGLDNGRLHAHAGVDLDITFISFNQVSIGERLRHDNEIIDPLATIFGGIWLHGAGFIDRFSHRETRSAWTGKASK